MKLYIDTSKNLMNNVDPNHILWEAARSCGNRYAQQYGEQPRLLFANYAFKDALTQHLGEIITGLAKPFNVNPNKPLIDMDTINFAGYQLRFTKLLPGLGVPIVVALRVKGVPF